VTFVPFRQLREGTSLPNAGPPTCVRAWHTFAFDADAGSSRARIISRAMNERDEERQLERGDSPVTASRRQDGEAETDVRLTGLIPRLTSPSRNNGTLVDIWFGVERRQRTYEWDEAFARVAEGWRPDPRQQSHFSLFSHPCSSALIVARQVTPDRSVWHEIEVEARALVSRVNRAVADQSTPPVQTRRPGGKLRRRRDATRDWFPRNWLSEAAQALRALAPKPNLPVSQSSSSGVR
jgi:hypothetical protein